MKETDRIQIVYRGESAYPARLTEIRRPPEQLYYMGNLKMLENCCAAVVGSRTTTVYGRNTGKAIASRLAERGVTVVSGMAAGIDSCAHNGALAVGGNTAAVLGCGVDICYPPENDGLKKELERKGLVLSEYDPGVRAERYSFPERNRIISGLCDITVVVQARNRSGALITAELAAEQGREVLAVPGNIDSQYNLGSNKLIREGATPLISIDDVLEPLGLRKASREQARQKLSDTEYEIFCLLQERGELGIDQLCCHTGKEPAYVNPIISVMEMKGFIFTEMGKVFLANA
ncbi:MAG: DNA-processing protein DprA [Bacillota bacterium]|nr:DNA-processing protein DprA [Bacillota bacterium]